MRDYWSPLATFKDGFLCGMVAAAMMAAEKGDETLAIEILDNAGIDRLGDLARIRNNPADEYDVDFLLEHFASTGLRKDRDADLRT